MFATGDEDYFVFQARETDQQCACCDPPFCLTEDYTATIEVTLPPGPERYEVCLSTVCGVVTTCSILQGPSSIPIKLPLSGSCSQIDNYVIYMRVRGLGPSDFTCEPYTLQYGFDALVCN